MERKNITIALERVHWRNWNQIPNFKHIKENWLKYRRRCINTLRVVTFKFVAKFMRNLYYFYGQKMTILLFSCFQLRSH